MEGASAVAKPPIHWRRKLAPVQVSQGGGCSNRAWSGSGVSKLPLVPVLLPMERTQLIYPLHCSESWRLPGCNMRRTAPAALLRLAMLEPALELQRELQQQIPALVKEKRGARPSIPVTEHSRRSQSPAETKLASAFPRAAAAMPLPREREGSWLPLLQLKTESCSSRASSLEQTAGFLPARDCSRSPGTVLGILIISQHEASIHPQARQISTSSNYDSGRVRVPELDACARQALWELLNVTWTGTVEGWE
ncbi:hypothetical protein NDU88_000445 [Pleurodeles waltl]|uniref:Uncharacterized protein n=1 Tax=Pleurodeles waltl TaxID=8319 RepID=A0AAV7TFS1_PLEWA|nr:hypothetical protein NDU88_000445 [Pleurodeles waltl]